MLPRDVSEFLGVRVGSQLWSVAQHIRTLAGSSDLGITPEVREMLEINARFLKIVSEEALALLKDDSGCSRSKLEALIRHHKIINATAELR